MIIALPAAGLHCSFLEAPFPLPTLASLLQLRHSWHGSRMLLLHRGNCSNSWKSSVSILVVAWLEIIRSWWMALLKLTQGIAEHCPALWGPLAGAVKQCWTKCSAPISPSARLNSWEQMHHVWHHFCLQHWGPEKAQPGLWWSITFVTHTARDSLCFHRREKWGHNQSS